MIVAGITKCELLLLGTVFFHDPNFAVVRDFASCFIKVGSGKYDRVAIGQGSPPDCDYKLSLKVLPCFAFVK
jgi:hypothetical protein